MYGSARTPTTCGLCANNLALAKCISVSAKYRIQHHIASMQSTMTTLLWSQLKRHCVTGDYHILSVPKDAYRLRIKLMKGRELAASISKHCNTYLINSTAVSSRVLSTNELNRLIN